MTPLSSDKKQNLLAYHQQRQSRMSRLDGQHDMSLPQALGQSLTPSHIKI